MWCELCADSFVSTAPRTVVGTKNECCMDKQTWINDLKIFNSEVFNGATFILTIPMRNHTNHDHLHLHRILCFMLSNTLSCLILIQPDEASNYCFTIRNVRFREFKWFVQTRSSTQLLRNWNSKTYAFSVIVKALFQLGSFLPHTSACQNVSSSCSLLCPCPIHFLRCRSQLSLSESTAPNQWTTSPFNSFTLGI